MVLDGFVWTMAFIGLSTAPPPIMWSFLRVMTTTRRCKVFSSNMTLGIPFHSHLMRSGSAIRVMAMWHILLMDAFVWFEGLLVFPLVFSFLGSIF